MITGTLVNTAAVVVGGLAGLLLKRGVPQRVERSVMSALGVGVFVVAMNGVISSMFTVLPSGQLSENGGLLLIISLALGTLLGELLRIDERLDAIGLKIEQKLKLEGFAKGFISASLIFCVGAMTIIGSFNDGLRGDPGVLYLKSALDFTVAVMLASSLGAGVVFAAVPVLVYQGALSLCAGFLAPLISPELMSQICMVGYAIVLCIGFNFIGVSKIKTANMLPALFLPIVVNMLMMLKTL